MLDDRHSQRLLESLEPQQRRFVEEYLKDLDASAAAIRAGYSVKTARQQASRLLRRKPIKDAIFAGQRLLDEREKDTVAAMRNQLTTIAFTSITDFFDQKGNLLPRDRWPSGAELALQSIVVRVNDDGTTLVKLRLSNRMRALAKVNALVDAIDFKLFTTKERFSRMSDAELDRTMYYLVTCALPKNGEGVTDHQDCMAEPDDVELKDDKSRRAYAKHIYEQSRYDDAMRLLSPQHRRFVEEYLKDFNPTAAAMRAGYSVKSARHQACRLMRGWSIRTAIDAGQHLQDDWAKSVGAKLQEKLQVVALFDIIGFIGMNGTFVPPDLWPAGYEHAVEAITIRYGKGGCIVESLKFANKISALCMLLDRLKARETL